MRLSREDALFLHNVLFRCRSLETDQEIKEKIDDLATALGAWILGSDSELDLGTDVDEDSEDEVEEELDEEPEDEEIFSLPDADDDVATSLLSDLPAISVTSPAGDEVTLEFEDVGDTESIDVLIDEGSVILDGVVRVRVSKHELELFTDDERHVFEVKRLPKSWSKALKSGVVYSPQAVEE